MGKTSRSLAGKSRHTKVALGDELDIEVSLKSERQNLWLRHKLTNTAHLHALLKEPRQAPDFDCDRLLKPMPELGCDRELAAVITRDIFVQNPNVRWSDIAGNEKPKQLLKEAVIYPMKYPQ